MTAKEYLEQVKKIQKRIERKENEILLLREKAEGISGIQNNDMPRNSQLSNDKISSNIIKIIELEEEIKELNKEIRIFSEPMKIKINSIKDSDARDLLRKHYIEFKPWKVVAKEMYISERKAYYIHQEAIELLD